MYVYISIYTQLYTHTHIYAYHFILCCNGKMQTQLLTVASGSISAGQNPEDFMGEREISIETSILKASTL